MKNNNPTGGLAPEPLTDAQVFDLLPDLQSGWTLTTFGLWVARAVERAHGIGGAREVDRG